MTCWFLCKFKSISTLAQELRAQEETQQAPQGSPGILYLNVGGQLHCTSRHTILNQIPNSQLAARISDTWLQQRPEQKQVQQQQEQELSVKEPEQRQEQLEHKRKQKQHRKAEDWLNEEGSLYYDLPSAPFAALLGCLRLREYCEYTKHKVHSSLCDLLDSNT